MAALSRLRLLGVFGAAAGTGALAAAPAAAAAVRPAHALTLFGSRMRVLGAAGRQVAGATQTVRGGLHTTRHGAEVGEFFSTGTVLAERRMFDGELGSLETHLFRLAEGTLTGAGTVHHDGTGEFTITGGTGKYTGAHGSYDSLQSADHSGSGEAVFTFKIGY